MQQIDWLSFKKREVRHDRMLKSKGVALNGVGSRPKACGNPAGWEVSPRGSGGWDGVGRR